MANETSKIEADTPGSYWRVWKTASRLEEEGLSSHLYESERCQGLTLKVVQILKRWGREWGGTNQWQSFLNKSSLQHEVEESIVALDSLLEWMEEASCAQELQPVTVVDVCCGKGVFSMLCSYVFQGDGRVAKIVMLDKAAINWHHVIAANSTCKTDHRPYIESWEQCNLHDYDIVLDRLKSLQSPLAMVGIHLCKMLGPAFVGLVNGLGTSKCPFLCLAPCCLPRIVLSKSRKKKTSNKIIKVPLYESSTERRNRLEAMQRRDQALGRGNNIPCYLCHSKGHKLKDCDLLPTDEDERTAVFKRAADTFPCWRCGVVGHYRANCTSNQSSSKPTQIKPPMSRMDVSSVLDSEHPFDAYCSLLTKSLQRNDIRLVETGLVNNDAQHQEEKNWNKDRKSIYILATA